MEELLGKILKIQEKKEWKNQQFNFFNVVGIETRENRHSAFIANLLKPEGTHKCGKFFLQTFMNIIKKRYSETAEFFDKLTDNVRVETEQNLEKIGRIDIWIRNKNEAKKYYLLIENKIYADDQKEQIFRYRNYLEKNDREGILLYLTLNGREATPYSTKKTERNKRDGYYIISYREDIKEWLQACLKKDLLLREESIRVKFIIEQYLELIDFLTYEQQLKDAILYKEKPTMRDPEEIAGALKNTKTEFKPYLENMLEYRFWKDLEAKIILEGFEISDRKKYNYHKIEQRRRGKETGYYGIIFKITDSKNNRICISKNPEKIVVGNGNFDKTEGNWVWDKKEEYTDFDKLIRSSGAINNFAKQIVDIQKS